MKNPILCHRILFILFVIGLLMSFSLPANAGKVQLPEGKELKVRFDPKMKISSGKLEKGVPLQIYLVEPIEIAGVVIVPKDAPGTAVVADIQKAGKPGKAGMIKIEFTELEPSGDFKSSEGEKIKLTGTIEKKGEGRSSSHTCLFSVFLSKVVKEPSTSMVSTLPLSKKESFWKTEVFCHYRIPKRVTISDPFFCICKQRKIDYSPRLINFPGTVGPKLESIRIMAVS